MLFDTACYKNVIITESRRNICIASKIFIFTKIFNFIKTKIERHLKND